jgi:hypothetical protein
MLPPWTASNPHTLVRASSEGLDAGLDDVFVNLTVALPLTWSAPVLGLPLTARLPGGTAIGVKGDGGPGFKYDYTERGFIALEKRSPLLMVFAALHIKIDTRAGAALRQFVENR